MTQKSGGDELARLLAGPSGLGTSACHLSPALIRRDIYAPLPYGERDWGDGSYPPLYCPATVRIDDDLADEVNQRLVPWAEKTGIYATQIGKFRDTGSGRLAMLTHPDSDDPDMLLVAAQMNAAWWAADDYYADETSLGATPTELPPRLALVMSAMDPPPPAGDYTRQLEEVLQADPVLVALKSATPIWHVMPRYYRAPCVTGLRSRASSMGLSCSSRAWSSPSSGGPSRAFSAHPR